MSGWVGGRFGALQFLVFSSYTIFILLSLFFAERAIWNNIDALLKTLLKIGRGDRGWGEFREGFRGLFFFFGFISFSFKLLGFFFLGWIPMGVTHVYLESSTPTGE